MKGKTEHHEHIHTHFNMDNIIKTIFGFLLLLLVVTTTLTIMTTQATKNEMFYNTCASSCSEKHFMGIQLGEDNERHRARFVNEFDRTDCIASCNTAYLLLRQGAR